MKSVLVALSGLVAPGFAHGLMGQRKMMWIVFASAYLAANALAFTVWASWLVFAIVLGSLVHAGFVYRRLGPTIRWSWLDPLLAFVAMIVLNITLRVFVVEAFKAPSTSMNPTLELGDHFFINKLTGSPSRGDVVVFRHPCDTDKDYVKRVIAVGGDTIEVRCSVVYLDGKPLARVLVEDGSVCRYEDFDGHQETKRSVSCSRYRETIGDVAFDIFHDPEQPTRDREHTPDLGGWKDYPRDAIPRSCANQEHGRNQTSEQAPAKLVVTQNTPANQCEPFMHLVVPPDSVFVMGDNRGNSNDSRFWGVVPASYVKGRATGRWLPIARFGRI